LAVAAQQQQAQHALRLVAILYLVPLPLPAVVAVGHIQTHNHQQLARVVMEVLAAAQALGKIPILTSAVELETRQALVRHKAITAVRGLLAPLPFLVWAVAAAAAVAQDQMQAQPAPEETGEPAQPQVFLAVPSLTQAVAVAAAIVAPHQLAEAQRLLAVAVTAAAYQMQTALQEQPTPAVVAVLVAITPLPLVLPQQAALASSSSSTTSALPQSLPSSHRRSGLHQRVR
jgi:hypothetical protein